jgi:succinyl-diaminopimelate desuccinylase
LLKIDEAIKRDTVALLQGLVRIKSANPPGNEDKIAGFVQGFLADNGIDTRLIPLEEGRSSVLARIPGKKAGSIVLCGHMDTVNADEEKWTVPVLEPRIRAGRMTGLGSADMKSGVAAIMTLAATISRQGLTPKKDLLLALTADEEYAYRGAASIADSGLIYDAELLVITEPTAGKAYIGQKGELWMEATFTGKAAHGSMPEQGINTILPASRLCLALAQEAEGFPEVPGRGRTTMNIGQINGGQQVNIVPDTTKVKLDSRVVSDGEKKRILDLVRTLGEKAAARFGARFSVDVSSYKPPIVSAADNFYIKEFMKVISGTDTTPELEIAPYSTDAVSIIPKLSIPVIIYGPGDIAQAHQPDEFLELSSLYKALNILARFLNRLVIAG